MYRRPDLVRLVEAAYAWEPQTQRWLDSMLEAALPFDVGGGVGYLLALTDSSTRVSHLGGSAPIQADRLPCLRSVVEGLPADSARHVLAPTEFAGNAAHRLLRLTRSTDPASAAVFERARRSLPPLWAIVAGNPDTGALVLCFLGDEGHTNSPDTAFPHRDARYLGLAAAHIGAALRLRTLLIPSPDDEETEAVLEPGGTVLHATGPARAPAMRASLVRAVNASERARGRMRRENAEEALQSWTALVEGRWTIIDSTEADGRRLILARRNPLGAPGLLDLTQEERDVVWLSAHGHTLKYVAYELGQPLSTVAERLRRGMQKLRVTSRAELMRRIGRPGSEK